MFFACYPQIFHNHCLQFNWKLKTENTTYAKFSGDKQRALWYVMVFSNLHKKKTNKLNDPCSCTKMTSPCTSPCSSCALLNPLQKLLANIFRVTRTTRLLELKAVMKGYVSCFQNAVTPTNLKAREYIYIYCINRQNTTISDSSRDNILV